MHVLEPLTQSFIRSGRRYSPPSITTLTDEKADFRQKSQSAQSRIRQDKHKRASFISSIIIMESRSELLPLRSESRVQEQRQSDSRRRRRALAGAAAVAAAVLLGLVAFFYRSPVAAPAYMADLNAIASKYKAQKYSAVMRVSVNGETKFATTMGLASEELQVPLELESVFPIGSNSKLFVSVALYQLQERGLVNLSLPVNDYLNQRDFAAFGLPNQTHWCPRLLGASPDSPCENVTFVNLLYMGSGIGDELNCDNVEPQYCHQSADDLAYYKGSIGAYVHTFINDPLVFAPGTNYSYSNPNYYLLSYLVEKLSGQLLQTYVQENIIDKIGLKHTFYDPYSGLLAVNPGYVDQYVDYFALGNGEGDADEYLSTGTCSPYMNSGALSGSGGFRSTVGDMQQWYLDLFHNHGRSSKVLGERSIREIVHRRNPVQPEYAQGVGVLFANESESSTSETWPSIFSYCGGMKCAFTCMRLQVLDSETSAVASVFTNHAQFYFATHASFVNWRPTEFMFGVGEEIVKAGTDYMTLPRDLLNGFLKSYV